MLRARLTVSFARLAGWRATRWWSQERVRRDHRGSGLADGSLGVVETAALVGAPHGTRLEVILEPTEAAWLPVAVYFAGATRCGAPG